MSAFEELGVMPEIITALDELDWHLPTPVQTEAVPLILGGGDVAVAAETGSGKTGAFCLPIVQIVYETRATPLSSSSPAPTDPSAPISLSTTDRGRLVAVDSAASIAQVRHPVIWEGVRATRAVASGAWYFTARPRDAGLCRVGWASTSASLVLGTDARGFGYGATAMKSHSARFDSYGEKYTAEDVIVCMLRFHCAKELADCLVVISYLKNETPLGDAFSIPFTQLGQDNLALFPAVALKNAEVELDFTRHSPYADGLGFKPMCDATVADGEIPAGIRKMFDAVPADMDVDSGAGANAVEKAPLALILEPSRELANQVRDELSKFSKYLAKSAVRLSLLVGGGNPKSEKALLKSGRDIVAGTLGTIVSHVKQGTLSLDNIRFFVLDEADTFATDNFADVAFLHQKVPARNRVQTLLFSATLHSPEIKDLSEKIQSFPTWVDLKGKETVPETVHHTMVCVDADADIGMLGDAPPGLEWPLDKVHISQSTSYDKKNKKKKKAEASSAADDAEMEDAADVRSQTVKKLKLLTLLKLIDAHDMSQAMIFVRTQQDGDNLESFLMQCSGASAGEINSYRFKGRRDSGPEVRYSCAVLHGGRRQQERNDALAAFKAGEVRFLICTDVAARGIDVIGLPYLVNMTLPDKSENYVHRVGRVGRAERLGLAVSLVAAQKEAVWFHNCGKPKGGICKNRKLLDAGGCVMWQNESKMLTEIEERLKGRIEELGSNYRRKDEEAGPNLYGSRVGEQEILEETAKNIEKLKPTVKMLMRMEEDVQSVFFDLKAQFGSW